MSVIPDTWEAEIRIVVRSQPGKIVHKTPSPKITSTKWTRGVAEAVECLLCKQVGSPEFKLQSHPKKNPISL
jgi:hypothetical protein